jgi:hypothetical protein
MIMAIIALMLTLSGCGKKGDPIPPKERLSGTASDCRVVGLKKITEGHNQDELFSL